MMRRGFILVMVLALAGCNSGDDGGAAGDRPSSGAIGDNENNRYELEAIGMITFAHTGGLICRVEDGVLAMDFSIDAGDGDYEYTAEFPGFDPDGSSFDGELMLTYKGDINSTGALTVSFGWGPAPDDFPGVVRAAGTFAGPLRGDAGAAEIAGSYACFLMDSEVGN